MAGLSQKKCIPCEGGTPLSKNDVEKFLIKIPNWELKGKKISRNFSFDDFEQSMKFVNKVAQIAESEGHHPDIHIHWNHVILELWTFAMDGLSENDFIMASKIDDLV